MLDQLRSREEVLGDRTFFAGDEFGFLDAVLILFSSMLMSPWLIKMFTTGSFKIHTSCSSVPLVSGKVI